MEVTELVDPIAQLLGIEGASVLATLAVVSLVARLIGKAIPDDRTGWVGTLRTVCKIVGLYTSNRVTSQVSVNDVAKVLLDSRIPQAPSGNGPTVEDAARNIK